MALIIKARGVSLCGLFPRFAGHSDRPYSKPAKAVDNKYTKTVLLPQTKFPIKLVGPKRLETDNYITEKCRFSDLYNWQRENLKGPDFVLHDGPPYANGDPHMGHAVNKILKDIALRSRVIRGQRVHYVPGWDCHGMPIEMRVLKTLNKPTSSLTPLEIRQAARQSAEEAVKIQREAFKSWGVMADWKDSGCYFTNNISYMANEFRQFASLYERNHVFRDFKPVYWSPSSRTALAESELQYNDAHKSECATVRLSVVEFSDKLAGLERPVYALTWTTTPWTLVANQALAYSPEIRYCVAEDGDKNYLILAEDLLNDVSQKIGPLKPVRTLSGTDLQGCRYRHPLTGEIMPFLAAEHVTNKLGTGLVHTAPAHGSEDFLTCLAHGIPVVSLVDDDGCYTSQAGEKLQGLNVLTEGGRAVLDIIGNNVLHVEELIHSYPYDWRTNKPVITRASYQWFINTDAVKTQGVEALRDVKMYPYQRESTGKKSLRSTVIQRPYWCISRQRAWGTPIPVFYHKTSGQVVTNSELIERLCRILEREGADCWWTLSVEKLIGKKLMEKFNLNANELEKGQDILDIWFDSGISWTLLPDKKADLYLEGSDQFNGWFLSSLLTSMALQGRPPFDSIFVHGFVVDDKGLKMSKSLGNVTSPVEILQGSKLLPAYGVDTLRWWVASHGVQHAQIQVSRGLLDGSAEAVQKIRIVLRFLLGVLHPQDVPEDVKPAYSLLDRYMFHRLCSFNREIQTFYDNHEFHNVSKAIVNFVTNDVSALYCHLTKDRLYCEDARSPLRVAAVDIIDDIFIILTRSIAPIVPHLAEEAWLYYPDNLTSVPLHHSDYIVQECWHAPDVEKIMNSVLLARSYLNKSNNVSKNTLTLTATLRVSREIFGDLSQVQEEEISSTSELCTLLQVSQVRLICDETVSELEIELKPSENPLCKRCRKYSTIDGDELCTRCASIVAVSQVM